MKNACTLGILGGLGPASSAYFYEMIINHTAAKKDNEHIDTYISSAASTPDRTEYLLDNSKESPLPRLICEAKKLQSIGCDVLSLPCNTAHYFFDEIQKSVGIDMINMIDETLKLLSLRGIHKIGVLATDGTVKTELYQKRAKEYGIECFLPDKEHQRLVMELIYDYVKGGIKVKAEQVKPLYEHLIANGAQKAVLACTELSILKKECNLDSFYLDALEVLAYKTIEYCKKTPIGFEELLYVD